MKDILINGSRELNVPITEAQAESLITYAGLLKEWNEKMNLTAISDDFGIAVKHFLDSMTAISTGLIQGKVIDVGCGAGFPGLVLKIAKPEIELTLLDSLKKRLTFLEAVTTELHISDVVLEHSRAEDGARRMREKFDTVVSRAVANMSVLSELCLPFLKPGGYFLALKGPLAEQELKDAGRAIDILGGVDIDITEDERLCAVVNTAYRVILVAGNNHSLNGYII